MIIIKSSTKDLSIVEITDVVLEILLLIPVDLILERSCSSLKLSCSGIQPGDSFAVLFYL